MEEMDKLEKKSNIKKFMKAQRLERRRQRKQIEVEKQLKNDQMRCSLDSLKKARQGVLVRLQNRQDCNVSNKIITHCTLHSTPDPSRLKNKKNMRQTKNDMQSSCSIADPGISEYHKPPVSSESHATYNADPSSGQITSKCSAASCDSTVECKVSSTHQSLTSSNLLQQDEMGNITQLNPNSCAPKLHHYYTNETKLNDNNTEITRKVEADIPLYLNTSVAHTSELAPLINLLGKIDTGVVKIDWYSGKNEKKNCGRHIEVNACIGQCIRSLLSDKTIYRSSPEYLDSKIGTNDTDVGNHFYPPHYSAISLVVEAIYRRQQKENYELERIQSPLQDKEYKLERKKVVQSHNSGKEQGISKPCSPLPSLPATHKRQLKIQDFITYQASTVQDVKHKLVIFESKKIVEKEGDSETNLIGNSTIAPNIYHEDRHKCLPLVLSPSLPILEDNAKHISVDVIAHAESEIITTQADISLGSVPCISAMLRNLPYSREEEEGQEDDDDYSDSSFLPENS